jgi:hypothetical protein
MALIGFIFTKLAFTMKSWQRRGTARTLPKFLRCSTYCFSRYSAWRRAGRSGDRIPVGARFFAPVQTGPGAHPSSCAMGTRYFPEVKSGRGVTLTRHPLLVPWPRKSSDIPLLPLCAVLPVQSLSACTRVHFTFTLQ